MAKQYEKLTDSRNFLHNLSRYYVNRYSIIGIENLQIKNMIITNKFAKYISDASWGKLKKFVAYKAERAGKLFLTVDCRGTTQRCSQCGNDVQKDLGNRIHKCTHCDFEAPRDYNSALEIKRLIFVKIRQELPKSTLVEMGALPSNWQLLSMNQETLL